MIATRIGAIPEIVINGKTGYIVEPQNAPELAARLDDLLQRRPGLARSVLERAVGLAHNRWLKAQVKPSSLPPKA